MAAGTYYTGRYLGGVVGASLAGAILGAQVTAAGVSAGFAVLATVGVAVAVVSSPGCPDGHGRNRYRSRDVSRPRPGSNPLAGLFDSLRGNRTRLVLTSSTLLFVELLLIRWIPSEVRYIGFFSNFLLMASFLGIGIGILLGRRRSLDTIAIFPVLLAIVVWLITDLELNVQIDSTDELFFGLAESGAADVNFLVLPVRVRAGHGAHGSAGDPARSPAPLDAAARGPGWDIAGSMLGIAAFDPVRGRHAAVRVVRGCGRAGHAPLAGTDSGGLVLRLAGTAGLAVVLLLTFGPEARTRSGRRTTGSTPTSSATARCT